MARRLYRYCNDCKRLCLVSGVPQPNDFIDCTHKFARQPMTPTVYYVNKAGEMWVPPDSDTKCPHRGYQRKEVQPHEIRKFEREQNARMTAEWQAERAREHDPEADRQRAEVRELLRRGIRQEARDWDSEHRELLEYAIEQQDSQVHYSHQFDPNFRIGSYE